MVFAYNIFIILYRIGIRIASLFNKKARLWVIGRKGWEKTISIKLGENKRKTIWIHSASLGEFEQGRTLIESIRKSHPSYRILVSFFSPSGFEVRKNYAGVDAVCYLPMDGKKNARMFLDIVRPSLVIFIKYDLWYYYLKTLHEKKIPTLLISAIILPSQAYFGLFGRFFQQMLNFFTHVFVQDENSKKLLQTLKIKVPVSVSGDTRFDRVFQIAHEPFHHKAIEHFCENSEVLIAGSTWRADEAALAMLQKNRKKLKLIIAPHEINPANIHAIKSNFDHALCLSDYTFDAATTVLILDSIGMLSKVYRIGTIAYVGGGFNKSGIHNILEAAVYGKVVFWGPQFKRSGEAIRLMATGAGYSFEKTDDFIHHAIQILDHPAERERANLMAKEFVQSNLGATSRIMVFLQDSNFL